MKQRGKFKKLLIAISSLAIFSLFLFATFFFISKSSNNANDSIVYAQEDSYFRNINPRFLVDFVNNQYIRFETVSSYSNPFENKKPSIWEKVKYTLGVKQERKGIQISLIDVSYDTTLSKILEERDIDKYEYSLNPSFELISSGREIGRETKDAVSKDTIISRNIYKGVDIEYQIIEGKGLKEEIVLNEIPEYVTDCTQGECILPVNRFLFKLELDEGLNLKRSMYSNEEYPSGVLYISDSEDNYFAHFLPEFAVDSVGNKTSNVVSNVSQTDKGWYMFEVILDSEWLLSEERVFPIRIDPSIVHDSEMVFSQGVYDRVSMDAGLMIKLNSDDYKSGTYTSGDIDLGENTTLNSISWQGFTQATGDGEIPFSTLGLIYEEGFNDLISEKTKWGSRAYQFNSKDEVKNINIETIPSDYFTLEFWSYSRYVNEQQDILATNLGNLKIKDGEYIYEDLNGQEYITNIPVVYNSWQYIALVFNLNSSVLVLYVDELEEYLDIDYGSQIQLSNIVLGGGFGYVDTLRVYDRLVARNELLSNSQYSNLYLQYSSSLDSNIWSDWYTKDQYMMDVSTNDEYIDIDSVEKDLGESNMLSFQFLSKEEQTITLGKNKFVNGIDEEDIIRLTEEGGDLELIEEVKYLDALFIPKEKLNACILGIGSLEVYVLDTGRVKVRIEDKTINLDDMYLINEKNHIALSFSDSYTNIFLNGNTFKIDDTFSLLPQEYSIGDGCKNSEEIFNGDITDVRISIREQDSLDIVEYSDIKNKSIILKPTFKANLQNEIIDLNSKTFSISEMPYGAPNFISNLHIGDIVVISEGDYSIEGEVISLDEDRGLVEVKGWEEGSTISELGFSIEASVLKWETEYIPTEYFLDRSVETHFITMKLDSILEIRDITLFSTINPDDTMFFENNSDRYIKYRFIFTTSKYGISSYLSNVNIDFNRGGPRMDQIMRHGKWFNEGIQQTFWWVK